LEFGSSSIGRDGGLPPERSAVGRRAGFAVAGVASLANGIALLGVILAGVPLPLGLLVCWSVSVLAVAVILRLSDPASGRRVARRIAAGLLAGVVATVVYDIAKGLLSLLDPAPFNPFEATRRFGELLVGPSAPDAALRAVGWVFHFANGATFGAAYALLFGPGSARRAVLTGVAFGVFLESFQLLLYPDWMGIRFVEEFQRVSFGGHLAYGATLGLLVARWAGQPREAGQATEGD
jgi:hypothetical protein